MVAQHEDQMGYEIKENLVAAQQADLTQVSPRRL